MYNSDLQPALGHFFFSRHCPEHVHWPSMASTHCGWWDGSDLIINKWDELSVIWVNYLASRDPSGLHMMPMISPSSHWERALLLQLGLDPCKDFSKVFLTDFVLQSLEAKPVPQLAPSGAGGTTHTTQSQITPGNQEGDSGEQLEQAELCGREEAVLGRISAGWCHRTHTHTLFHHQSPLGKARGAGCHQKCHSLCQHQAGIPRGAWRNQRVQTLPWPRARDRQPCERDHMCELLPGAGSTGFNHSLH